MSTFTLVKVPGGGVSSQTVAFGTTLAQFAADKGLTDREFTLNDEPVDRENWSTVLLDQAIELFAVKPNKGN
jgi:sulfur carrier protein ThiS